MIIEVLIASAILICRTLRILPLGITVVFLMGAASMWVRREGVREIGLERHRISMKIVLLSVAFGVAYQALSLIVLEPALFRLIGARPNAARFAMIRGDVSALLRSIATAWTLAAIGEEFIYRGYLLNHIRRALGDTRSALWIAIVWTTALFAFTHIYQGVAGVISVSVAGFALAFLYVLSRRNLWAAIIAHGVIDTTAFLLIFFGRYPSLRP
jgi:CAAX protease family protein